MRNVTGGVTRAASVGRLASTEARLAVQRWPHGESETTTMLWTIVLILLALWLLGFFVVHVGGALIHILLVLAVVVIIANLLRGRSAI